MEVDVLCHNFMSNLIDVLFLCVAAIWIDLSLNKKHSRYIMGIIFGLSTVFVMQDQIMVVAGRYFDFRYITMIMAGFIGGPVSAAIAALISSIYQYNVVGIGIGLRGGIANIIIFALLGSILGRLLRNSQKAKKPLFCFIIGIFVVCIRLFITEFITPWLTGTTPVLGTVSVLFLIITPLAMTIILTFYFWAFEFFNKASMLNTIINHSPINLMIFDDHGPILFSKNLKTDLQSYPYFENPNLLLDHDQTWLSVTKQQQKEIVSEDQKHFVTNLSSFQMPNGEYSCLAIINDVTEKRKFQKEILDQFSRNLELQIDLSKSNLLISSIMTHMPDVFYVLDDQWRFTFVNKKAEKLFLKTREQLLGKVLWEVYPQTRGCICELYFNKAKNDCLPITFEIICPLNKDIWHQVTASPSPFGMSVYYRDVTERKSAHERLIKSQEETISILESMTDCFYALDRNLQFTYVNRAAEIAFGKSRDKLLGKKMTEVFEANVTALLHYNKVITENRSMTIEVISEALGNKWLELSVYPTESGVTCYFRDITSRKLAEKTLRQSEEKFCKAFHGGPIMMTLATVDDGRFIDVNEAWCSGTGYPREELIGRTSKDLNFFVEIVKRQELEKMLMKQGKLENVEFDFRTRSGEIRQGLSWSQLFEFEGKLCHITGLIDITEQKRIQKEMAKLDRLNIVGQLAAGIAHEVRNPMTTVRGYLQLLGANPEYEAKKSTFDLMISEVDRANSIITEFLSLAQSKPSELISKSLNDIINNLYPLLEADAFTQNKQIYFMPWEIPNLELNAKEISQLILNLTRNGLEAMEERGSLTIKSYVKNSEVVLEVADEGCGIQPEHISKVGTPFFTTKATGTGLGLASSYKIAESHSAKVRIESSPSGTTFFVHFPIPVQRSEQNVKTA
ncbi:MAG: PAS domain S-box protein [Desulfosporosinus sp.]|nr:PAS domain S-box protein [Desulfosporosinus sp.]